MKTRFELNEMTRAELVEYAEGQGVSTKQTDNKGTVIDKILGEAAQTPDALPPSQERPAIKKQIDAPDIPLNALYSLDGKRITGPVYKLTIFGTQQEKGPVDIVVNGYNVRIKRDVEVRVLGPYVEALKNAVIHTIEKDPDTGIETPRTIQNYPFQAVLETEAAAA